MNTLQAPFTLTIRRALLKTPTVTKGTLYLQGSDFAHFSLRPARGPDPAPDPQGPASPTAPPPRVGETLKIGFIRNANRQFLGLGQKLSYLSDYFKISLDDGKEVKGTLMFTLRPRSLSMKKRMEVLYIWVDKESYLPRQVNWVERGGDSWLLELGPLATNQPLPGRRDRVQGPARSPAQGRLQLFRHKKVE